MVRVKPFAAVRPPRELVTEVAAPPYDVLNSQEAKQMAGEKSLLHITKPEIDFDPIADEHSQPVYDKAVANFKAWQEKGWLVQDSAEQYYVYAQRMGKRTQYGLVLCAHTDDYATGKIKKHELTRKDKEDDRMIHVRIQNANIEPVFFAYKDNAELNAIVAKAASGKPEYDFVDENGFGHTFWVIADPAVNARITELFTTTVEAFYVADGHHRTAAAARVGAEKKAANPNHTGQEEYNWFMAVCFPQSQLQIIDYNRVVRDLNGLTPEAFLKALEEDFEVSLASKPRCGRPAKPYAPAQLHEFSVYLGGNWYKLAAKPDGQTHRLRRRYPRSGRTGPPRGQWRNGRRLRPLSRVHAAAHRHCRQRKHYAAQDDLVRTQAPERLSDSQTRLRFTVPRRGRRRRGWRHRIP